MSLKRLIFATLFADTLMLASTSLRFRLTTYFPIFTNFSDAEFMQ
jgi:hypothetical protein